MAFHVHGDAAIGGFDHDYRLGVGTDNPWTTLHAVSDEGEDPLRVMVGDNTDSNTSIRAYGHQGVAIGRSWSDDDVPERGLRVYGDAVKPGGGMWSSPSDERLKTNTEPLEESVLDRLLSLRGYTFEFREEALERDLGRPGEQTGLLAQEVAEVFPEWVDEDGTGHLYVTERGTTALLVEALREIRAERDRAIDELVARASSCEEEVETKREESHDFSRAEDVKARHSPKPLFIR